MRSLTAFGCVGETLIGTLDLPSIPAEAAVQPGLAPSREHRNDTTTGLLIVSGGNEIRIGAHRGMALLAARVAAAGYPVFRFDRRGVGDSTGANGGFETSAPDIAAAAAHFRALQPQLTRVVGFGNCDAATALALFGRDAGIDDLVLANPWTIEPTDDLPPPAAIRARYAAKLKAPREWWRLLSGGVNFGKLARGLRKAGAAPSSALADRLRAALPAAATILTARGDNTAIAFRAALPQVAVTECDTASHSFAGPENADWLFERLIAKLC
ncbi:MAG: hydrolase 1, exosortase A system-associated [Pseudomonadota bacterium]